MITMEAVVRRVGRVDVATLEVWIAREWVRPRRAEGAPVFEEIDVARVQLIVELRETMAVDDGSMPVVLSLLDQLHASRGQMRRLCAALEAAGDAPARSVVVGLMRRTAPGAV